MDNLRVAAIIPAAGLSSRMRAFKPLLTIGGKTMIERVIELFRAAGLSDVLIVAGHRSEELIPVVEAASCRYVVNRNHRNGMFSSIQRGVKELYNTCDAFFVLPVDIPLVHPDTIRRLLDSFFKNSSAPVYYPQFQSRRGHPPLLASALIDPLLACKEQDGLRGLLNRYENQAMVVPVSDPFISMDADTWQDLIRLRKAFLQAGTVLRSNERENSPDILVDG